MGFTTNNRETELTTYNERKDVRKWIDKIAEEQGWDLTDVRHRALMKYIEDYRKGRLEDPYVDLEQREIKTKK